MNKKLRIGLLLMVLCIALFIAGIIVVQAAFHTDSLYITTIYPFMPEVLAAWQPTLLPGWQLDTSQNCIGQMRLNVNRYICDYTHFFVNNQWTFVFLLPNYVCGKSNVSLQPFVLVFNPTTGAHDTIYGDMIVDNSFAQCHAAFLPVLFQKNLYLKSNLTGKLAPYPSPYP